MMTRNPFYSHIVVVWLVLLAFLCLVVVPSVSFAKKEMTIATEGDPEDGLDYAGGGGGYTDAGNDGSSDPVISPQIDRLSFHFEIYPLHNFFLIIPNFNQDYFGFNLYVKNIWKAEK